MSVKAGTFNGSVEDLMELLSGGAREREAPSPERIALAEAVKLVSRASTVQRFHTQNRIKQETVGTHSFNVAWIAFFLADRRPSVNLLLACLAHDVPEKKFGDIPGDYKASLGSIFKDEIEGAENALLHTHGLDFELSDDEKRILRLSDLLDGFNSCRTEHAMGNCMIHEAEDNYQAMTEKFLATTGVSGTKFGDTGMMLFEMMGGFSRGH